MDKLWENSRRMRIARGTSFDGLMYDITEPNGPVEVQVSKDKSVLWVNGVLRVCRINELEVKQ